MTIIELGQAVVMTGSGHDPQDTKEEHDIMFQGKKKKVHIKKKEMHVKKDGFL